MKDADLLESRVVHHGRVVDVTVDRVRLPNGNVAELDLVHFHGAAAVVPLTEAGEVLLLRQFRYATGGWLVEIPAGKLAAGEEPGAGARRELEEETGFRACELTPLGWMWSSPGVCDERIWLFLATGLERGRQSLDPDEVLSLERVPLASAVARATNGEIQDAKTALGLLRAAAHLRS